MIYVLIRNETAWRMEIGETDMIAAPPDASLVVSEPDWIAMCEQVGGEARLMAELGVTWNEEDANASGEG